MATRPRRRCSTPMSSAVGPACAMSTQATSPARSVTVRARTARGATLWSSAVAEAATADDHSVAPRAVRALTVTERAGDVAWVDIAQAGPTAELIGVEQRRRGRVAIGRHLVVLVEGRDVPRNVGI